MHRLVQLIRRLLHPTHTHCEVCGLSIPRTTPFTLCFTCECWFSRILSRKLFGTEEVA